MLDWYTLQLKRGADGLFGFSVSSRANCEIDKITKGSSAKESGLKVGDQIFAINDKLVFSTNEIEDMMKNTGHSVSLRVRKAGTTLYISEMRIINEALCFLRHMSFIYVLRNLQTTCFSR